MSNTSLAEMFWPMVWVSVFTWTTCSSTSIICVCDPTDKWKSKPIFEPTVTVTVGSKIGLDFHLSVGSQTQIIEVEEQVVQVNTETQTIGQNISANEVLDIPTITRNPYDLVKTVGNTTDADPSARGVGVS